MHKQATQMFHNSSVEAGKVLREIPELTFEWDSIEDRSQDFKETLYNYGCVLLKQAIHPMKLKFYRSLVQRTWNQCVQKCNDAGIDYMTASEQWWQADEAKHMAINLHHGQIQPSWFERYCAGFSLFDLVSTGPFHFLLSDFFGQRYEPSDAAHVRVAHPLRKTSDYQDFAGFGRKLNWHADAQPHGGNWYTINLWTPFDACGLDRPGLQTAVLGHEEASSLSGYEPETGQCNAEARLSFNSEGHVVDRATKFAPIMNPGDIFVFSHWTPHSTFVTPEMQMSRMSAELRLTYGDHHFPD